jgi:hypothetical protein
MRIQVVVLALGLAGLSWGQAVPDTLRKNPALKPVEVEKQVENWPECDEYLSQRRCRVTVNLSNVPQPDATQGPFMPHAHWDVQVKPFVRLKAVPLGEAVVLLAGSSPFLTCTVSAVPAAPARDLSANVGSLLTAVAGIGAVPSSAPAAGVEPLIAPPPPNELDRIKTEIDSIDQAINGPYGSFKAAVQKDWKFTFPSNQEAADAIADLLHKTEEALSLARWT